MADRLDRCTKQAPFPKDVGPSDDYRAVFNATAKDLGVSIVYVEDASQGHGAVPETAFREVEVAREAWGKYGVREARPRASAKLAADICTVRAEVERRRQAMGRVGIEVYPVQQSGTYAHDKLKILNPAERAWFERIKATFYEVGQDLYMIQALPGYAAAAAWMRKHADPVSQFHFERVRAAGIPSKDIPAFPNAKQYASAIPWFPKTPDFSTMWPADLSQAELEYINKHYPANDAIRQPVTRVSRITKEEAQRIGAAPMTSANDRPVEWVREGLDGRLYRVVNMAFDPEMRPHFLKLAAALRAHADVAVHGTTLDPAFREQTLAMADAMERGDFAALLKADLAQASGNLFITLFPHEGYWADGVKYPMMGEIGIIDADLLALVADQGYVLNWLGKAVERAAHAAGLTDYQAQPIDTSNLRRDAIFIWAAITTGFMRAYGRDPGGHDYPKVAYDGVDTHRNVALLDTLETWTPLAVKVAEAVFGPNVARHVSFDAFARATFLHEGSHGAQIRQTVKVLSGKPFGESLGIWWGPLVEAWADAGSILGHHQLYRDGKISEAVYQSVVATETSYNLVRLYPRAASLSDGMAADGPHITGSGLLTGWLYGHGAYVSDGNGDLRQVEDQIIPAVQSFFDALTAQAALGDQAAFKAFAKQCVEMLPESIELSIIAKKKALASYTVLDRGELLKP